MSFELLAKKRYSCRSFTDRKVEAEKRDKLLELCLSAPTAQNRWPLHLYVIESPSAISAVKAATKSHFDASLFILVCYDKAKTWVRRFDDANSGIDDAAIVGCHIMFGVEELGLGTTWVKAFDPSGLSAGLNIPENLVPVCLFPIGYKSDDAKPAPAHFVRPILSEVTTFK